MTNKILFTCLILLCNITYAQPFADDLKIDGYVYPKISVSNLMRWILMTTNDWEKEMQLYHFEERNISNGCVYYGSGSSLSDAVLTMDKCPGNAINIYWSDFKRSGRTVLDGLLNELEKHYITKDEDFAYYGLKDQKYAYVFRLSRNYELEALFVERKLISEFR